MGRTVHATTAATGRRREVPERPTGWSSGDGWRGGVGSGQTGRVTGPIIVVVVLLVAIPVGVLVSGGAFAAILGTIAAKDADDRNEGTEYVELGR